MDQKSDSEYYLGGKVKMTHDEVRNIIQDWFTSQYSRVRVTKDDAQSIPDSTWTKIQYDDKDYDSLKEYDNITNHRFTAVKAGYYLIIAQILLDNTAWTDGEVAQLTIRKNGVAIMTDRYECEASETKYVKLRVSDILYLIAGDYIEGHVYQNSGGAINIYNSSTYNSFLIHRI